MVAVPTTAEPDPSSIERRLVIHNVSWDQYSGLLASLDGHPGLHITYLAGSVEIVTNSPLHERAKKRLARLFEAWTEEAEVDVEGYGETTFRKQIADRGLEADECYTLGRREDAEGNVDRPDLAIEVVVSRPLLDKLQVYAGLEVPEVWTWTDGVLVAHILEGDRYRASDRSRLFPGFDFKLAAELLQEERMLDAVKRLRKAIRPDREA